MNRFAYAKISLSAITHNFMEIRRVVGNDRKIMAVVKANAYGHGVVEVAEKLSDLGADYFGVATLDEGMELRDAGIEKPLLVLGHVGADGYGDAVKNRIDLSIFSYYDAVKLNDVAKFLNMKARVHIKVNTGMNRLGFEVTPDGVSAVAGVCDLPNLDVVGIFSHFATSDHKDKTVANRQFDKFVKFIAQLRLREINIPIKHMANSGAVIDMPHTYLDMVRPGIMLYGEYPSAEVCRDKIILENAMTFIGKIVQIRRVPIHTAVSYGGTWVAERDSVIATIPVGYEDGYFRLLSNKAWVLHNGQRLPQIGNICMDQFMIDITDCPRLSVGDEVVIYGSSDNERITLEDIANLVGTINYEIGTSLSRRVVRIYE